MPRKLFSPGLRRLIKKLFSIGDHATSIDKPCGRATCTYCGCPICGASATTPCDAALHS